MEELTPEELRRQFDVNVFGVVNSIQPFLPSLKATRGRICLVGSACAYLTSPGTTAYSMSKYAVRALAEGLYAELAPYGVAVTLINPGFIQTDIRKIDNTGVLRADQADPIPAWLMMDPRVAARKIYRAIRARKRERAVTIHAQLGIWMARFFPGILAAVMRHSVRR